MNEWMNEWTNVTSCSRWVVFCTAEPKTRERWEWFLVALLDWSPSSRTAGRSADPPGPALVAFLRSGLDWGEGRKPEQTGFEIPALWTRGEGSGSMLASESSCRAWTSQGSALEASLDEIKSDWLLFVVHFSFNWICRN